MGPFVAPLIRPSSIGVLLADSCATDSSRANCCSRRADIGTSTAFDKYGDMSAVAVRRVIGDRGEAGANMGDLFAFAVGDTSMTGGNRFATVCTGDSCSIRGIVGTTTRPTLEAGLGDTEGWVAECPGFVGGAGAGATDRESFDKRPAMWGSKDSNGTSVSL